MNFDQLKRGKYLTIQEGSLAKYCSQIKFHFIKCKKQQPCKKGGDIRSKTQVRLNHTNSAKFGEEIRSYKHSNTEKIKLMNFLNNMNYNLNQFEISIKI